MSTSDPTPTEDAFDADTLPPTQYLILEVLAARYRTGEQSWTFPSKVRHHLDALAKLGLIGCKGGIVHGTALAWFTAAGRSAALLEGYEPAAAKHAYAAGREAGYEAGRHHGYEQGHADGFDHGRDAGPCMARSPVLFDQPPLICELLAGHPGGHVSGVTSWTEATP